MSKLSSSKFCHSTQSSADALIVALLWKLLQMPLCSNNNANLDKTNFDIFYKNYCWAVICYPIGMTNVSYERGILVPAYYHSLILVLWFFFSFFRDLKLNMGFLFFFTLTLYIHRHLLTNDIQICSLLNYGLLHINSNFSVDVIK